MGKADRQREERRAAAVAARQAAERQAQQQRRRNKLYGLFGAALLAVAAVIAVVIIATSGGGNTPTSSTTGGNAKVPTAVINQINNLPQHGNTLGSASAPVTLTEFVDLQCPYCDEYELNTWPSVVKQLVATKQIKVQLETLDFLGRDDSPNESQQAARAAYVALKANRIFQFATVFYSNQHEENTGYVTQSFIRSIAEGSGVNPTQAVKAMTNSADDTLINSATTEGNALNIQGTPSFFLTKGNGQPQAFTSGDRSYASSATFIAQLKQALAKLN
jgi:protein-disulfide isomerase